MKAFAINRYGDDVRAVEAAEPSMRDGDVLVDVRAASINHLDERIRVGDFKQLLPYRFPLILGNDLAGTVVAVGGAVRRFSPGDTVYARPDARRIGAFAERMAIAEQDLALVPSTVSIEAAASLPLVALTSWQALVERGNVQPGHKVLIHAGAGAVGSIAIQLAKHLGAFVASTASGADAARLRELGADLTIDYRTENFATQLSGYDLVLDSLGGDTLRHSLGILRPGGKVVGISGPPDPAYARAAGLNPVVRLAVGLLSSSVRRQARRLGVSYEFLFMHASGEQLAAITDLVDQGIIRPHVGRVFPFQQTPDALAALSTGRVRGKIVVARS